MTRKSLTTKRAWLAYFRDIGLRDDLCEEYSLYAGLLLKKSVPVIFNWHHLAALLGVSIEYVASVHSASSYHYREFRFPKRSGGYRTIDAPRAALKDCQRWILDNILNKMQVHPAAKGFVKKRSIKDHATVHLGHGPTIKMDFKDFFPSISKGRVISLFRSFGYSDSVSLYLASFCCLDERLPQGAPTSPYIANLMCRSLDARITALAKSNGWVYSRYADDLAISGTGLRFSSARIIKVISESEGFNVNDDKTRFYSSGARRVITGISVGKETISIPRKYKREVAKDIYFINKFGLLSHIAKTKIREPDLLRHLAGKLEFWLYIEPESDRANKLKSMLEDAIVRPS